MLALAFIALILSGVRGQSFNITDLIVPEVVPPEQTEVEVECRYDANFTVLNWFKGLTEFFRYQPGAAPSTKSYPVVGVGRVELISCGPTACRLKLGALTQDATGLYRCDIERHIKPYMYNTRSAYMTVYGHEHRRPLLEGLADEFEEGQEMQAYCRGAPDTEIRWYINGKEIEDMRGSTALKKKATRLFFLGIPPVVTVQCAEHKFGNLSGSKEMKARWKDVMGNRKDERPQEQRNGSTSFKDSALVVLHVIYIVLYR